MGEEGGAGWKLAARSSRLRRNYADTLELRWSARVPAMSSVERKNRRILPQDSCMRHARLAGRARREGSRSEVRGFQNFEPRTSNFGSHLSRMSRTSSPAVCDAGGLFQHPARRVSSLWRLATVTRFSAGSFSPLAAICRRRLRTRSPNTLFVQKFSRAHFQV
jgi:hypothetical protein